MGGRRIRRNSLSSSTVESVMSIETRDPGTARAEDSAPALDRDILDALTSVLKRLEAAGHAIAAGFGISPPDLFALFKLDEAIPMKDLAQRMGCDASFITTIADSLEARGYARREPGQRDRRIKNLVLTDEGTAAREHLITQLAGKMPWSYALDETERECFLSLLLKMINAPRPEDTGVTGV
jgi:DNA-binding MarR family transcriptional regulator